VIETLLSSGEQSFQYRTEGQGWKIPQTITIIKQLVSRNSKVKTIDWRDPELLPPAGAV